MDFSNKEERADIYRLLAGVFLRQADTEIFETLSVFFNIEVKDTPEDILNDSQRLFSLLPPYESFYSQRAFIGKRDLHDFYESHGLMIDEELGLPPDHIGVEMLFMSYLVENKRLSAQKTFLEEHLLKWILSYLDIVNETAGTGFYKTIALLTKEFLLSDYKRLST